MNLCIKLPFYCQSKPLPSHLWEQFVLDTFSFAWNRVLLHTPGWLEIHCVVHAGLELAIFLPQFPECWDSRHAPTGPMNWPTQTHMLEHLVPGCGYRFGAGGCQETFCVRGLAGWLRANIGAELEGQSCLVVVWALLFLASSPDGSKLHENHMNSSLCHTFPATKMHFLKPWLKINPFFTLLEPGILSVFLKYSVSQAHSSHSRRNSTGLGHYPGVQCVLRRIMMSQYCSQLTVVHDKAMPHTWLRTWISGGPI